MDSQQKNIVSKFLNSCGVTCDSIDDLDGIKIPREILLSEERYAEASKAIPTLKEIYSSSYMTSLQKNAKKTQQWPLINIVRQILKSCGYSMKPLRVANGYTKSGKKLYRRFFVVTKIKVLQKIETCDEASSNSTE
tara:strand:+ start:63 stop:470 length:408 start_codon:yes stop_codon:yes gene_type:complete